MKRQTVFLFGEAEKGAFCTPLVCRTLPKLAETLGHPPEDSRGIEYAIQALLYKQELIYFRVKEEGFSVDDYFKGLQLLQNTAADLQISALCLPGMGDKEVIKVSSTVCKHHKSILIINEQDLYDYLTD